MTHRFESAGLGLAPYRCLGYSEITFKNPDGTLKAGGSCDYCAQAIRHAVFFRSSDGKRFKLGCDCAMRSGDAAVETAAAKIERQIARDKRAAQKSAVKAEWAAMLADERTRAILSGARDDKGREWLKVAEWAFPRLGATGQARWLKKARAIVTEG